MLRGRCRRGAGAMGAMGGRALGCGAAPPRRPRCSGAAGALGRDGTHTDGRAGVQRDVHTLDLSELRRLTPRASGQAGQRSRQGALGMATRTP